MVYDPKIIRLNSSVSPLLLTISWKMPSSVSTNSAGLPNSAATPSFMTRMRSKSATVLRRCAITNSVVFVNASRMDRWIRISVSMSTAEVASSRMRIFGRDRIARARQSSCFWPCDRFDPPEATGDDKDWNMLVFPICSEAAMVELAPD